MDTLNEDSGISWKNLEIPATFIENWQKIVDILAKIFKVPSALIMRIHPPTIEVFLSSHTEGNPYEKGEEAEIAGLYCTTVIRSQNQLLVPDARKDPVWDHNPDIVLGMVSYLGMPINWPDGDAFGTVCVLDSQENAYSAIYVDLLKQFRGMIENQLELLVKNQELFTANKQIAEFRKVIPKCSFCESVRLPDDAWVSIDDYLLKKRSTTVTHSVCPKCSAIHYGDLD